MIVTIYELLDPTTLECRYVGQTVEPKARLAHHIGSAKRGSRRWIYNWIRSMLNHGFEPMLREIETCNEIDADEREAHWIKVYRSYGVSLTNLTEGGGGLRGLKHTTATKEKIGKAHAGKKMRPESIAKMVKTKTGVRLSPEHRAVAVSALRRRVWTDEQRRSISERMKGNKCGKGVVFSEERRLAMARHSGGENGVNAKCTNDQARQIRALFASGEKQSNLAERFGISRVDVHRIVRNKTYVVSLEA